jgi:hypothetical protein
LFSFVTEWRRNHRRREHGGRRYNKSSFMILRSFLRK